MKKLILLLLIVTTITVAQNQAPAVQNVRFEQRTDGSFIVDIYYDVNDSDGNTMTVTIQVSDDNGANWDFTANNVSGDVGIGITNGTNKHIVWNFGTEHPNTFSDQIRIKIIADDDVSEGCPPTITYASKTYNTVQIGSQCWLKENLDVGTMIISDGSHTGQQQTDNGTIEKYCYDYDETNCNTYGGLYEWNEAMKYVTTEGTQGICPNGWHIPTYAEMQALETYVNDKATKLIDENAKSGYTYTNETGFSALFAGYRNDSYGSFNLLGYHTYFWSSTEYSNNYACNIYLNYHGSNVDLIYNGKNYGISVRCVKD